MCGVDDWGRGRETRERERERRRIAYLACRINDLRRKFLAFVSDDFAECVLDGGIVALDEVAVDELHRHARLACPPLR